MNQELRQTQDIYIQIKTKELARNEINDKTSENNLHISPYTLVVNKYVMIVFLFTKVSPLIGLIRRPKLSRIAQRIIHI